MTALLCWKVQPARDLALAAVALAGGLAFEWWGTHARLWCYFTGETPPPWILPAWPVAALATSRIALLLERVCSKPRVNWQVAYWGAMVLFAIGMVWFVWPSINMCLSQAACGLIVLVVVLGKSHRRDCCLFLGGTGLGFFLEYWGTTRECWTYYSGETPPLITAAAHGFAQVCYARTLDAFTWAGRRISRRVRPGLGDLSVMLLITGLLGCFPHTGCAAEALPAASEVTRRMIERAQAVARAEQGPQYTYEKRALSERLDAAGQVLRSEEKTYLVTLIADVPFNRLVKVKGRELSDEELKREEAREQTFRQRFVSADATKAAARKAGWVTPELMARYQFEVRERVILSNRPTLVVKFRPREGDFPSATIQDRVLNGMAGTLWIDEADAEPARLIVGLGEPVPIGWFGLLASLNRCEISLERQRMPDGVWINAKQTLLIHFRRLTATTRARVTEESSGFRKLEVNRGGASGKP